jgi:hypothetical protein
VLVDGNNHQFERIQHEAGRRGVHVDVVIDFVHVLEYLWKAAEDLHPTPPHPTPPHPTLPARPPARGTSRTWPAPSWNATPAASWPT